MKYILVSLKVEPVGPVQPVLVYSEINDTSWEQRKVCVFREGPPGYASCTKGKRGVMLSFEPVPSLSELANNTTLEAAVITKEEFEAVWEHAISDPVDSQEVWGSVLKVLAHLWAI